MEKIIYNNGYKPVVIDIDKDNRDVRLWLDFGDNLDRRLLSYIPPGDKVVTNTTGYWWWKKTNVVIEAFEHVLYKAVIEACAEADRLKAEYDRVCITTENIPALLDVIKEVEKLPRNK